MTDWIKTGAWPGITLADSLVLQGTTTTASLAERFGIRREFVNLFTEEGTIKHTWVPASFLKEVGAHLDQALAGEDSAFCTAIRDYRPAAAAFRLKVEGVGTGGGDEALLRAYVRLRELQSEIITFDQVGILGGEHLASRVMDLLAERVPDPEERQRALESFCASWWPSSLIREEIAILEIAATIADARRVEDVVGVARTDLERLARDFGTLAQYMNAEARTVFDYAVAVVGALERPGSLVARIEDLRAMPARAEREATALADELGLGAEERRLVELFREVLAARNESALELGLASSKLAPLRAELLQRLDLDPVTARVLFDDELAALLRGELELEAIDIEGRFDCSGYSHTHEQGFMKLSPAEAKVLYASLTGHEAEPAADDTAKHGICACAGTAVGRVRVVERMPAGAFEPGEILITTSATVDFHVVLTKAAAIVTEHGGIGCHAAIVAREARVPAVVGYAGATRRFQTGQLVRVDAAGGTVTIIDEKETT